MSELGCSMDEAVSDSIMCIGNQLTGDKVWGGILHGISETSNPEIIPLGYGVLKGPQVSKPLSTHFKFQANPQIC